MGRFVKLSEKGSALVWEELKVLERDGSLAATGLPNSFNRLTACGHAPSVLYVTGDWLDVNDAFNLARARNFT